MERNRFRQYEEENKKLVHLTGKEYQEAVKKLAERLKI